MKNISLILILLLFACCTQKPKSDEFLISGQLDNTSQELVVLQEITPEKVEIIDSVKIDKNGVFSFLRKLPYQSLYVIQLNSNEYITILPNYGENIHITGDSKSFSGTYMIEGSPGSQQLWDLNKKNLEGITVVASLSKAWDKAKREGADLEKVKDSLDGIFEKTLADQRQYVLDFVNKNQGSLVTLIGIYKSFNNRELLTPYKDIAIYEKAALELKKNLPGNPHAAKFAEHVQKMKIEIAQKEEKNNGQAQ